MIFQRFFGLFTLLVVIALLFGCSGTKTDVTTENEVADISEQDRDEVSDGKSVENRLAEPEIQFGEVTSYIGDLYQLTSNESDNGLGNFHPDGQSLIFQSKRDGLWQIYSLNLLGGFAPEYIGSEQRLIVSEFNDENPVWTKDGKKVLFTSDRDRNYSLPDEWQRDIYLFEAEASGGSDASIEISSETTITRLTHHFSDDWFPVPVDDESFMFLSERDAEPDMPVHARGNSLYKGFYDGREPIQILGPESNPSAPLELRDDKLIVRNQNGQLVCYPVVAGKVNLTDVKALTLSEMRCGGAAVNAKNGWLTFNARKEMEKQYQLYLLKVGTYYPTVIDTSSNSQNILQRIPTAGDKVRYPRFSPDGTWILFTAEIEGYFQLFRLPIVE